MKKHRIFKGALLSSAIALALAHAGSANAIAAEAPAKSPSLAGKNFVQELHKNGTVKRTIITGDAGDGINSRAPEASEALSVAGAKSSKAAVEAALPFSLQGHAAAAFLGNNFAKVAADNDMTPDRLTELLSDPSVHLDSATGKLFVIDSQMDERGGAQDSAVSASAPASVVDGMAPTTVNNAVAPQAIGPAASAVTPTTMLSAPPLTDVFTLHSNLGASKVIYIDFDGQLVHGSAWSATDIVAPAYDLNGDPLVFDDNERANIYSIWARVAEDYLPFDVDVTTQEPVADAITKNSSTDKNFGTRVVVTKTGTIGCSCGGIAYVGVFNSVNAQAYQPAWAFQQSLGNNEKYIAEAISHEAGHNLGLSHDGSKTVGYYGGHGDGATSWAPIMGVGYYKNVTQWSAGVYPLANNKQNDLAIFAANGLPAKADDYGSTIATAANLTMTESGATNTAHAFGVIETGADKDMFVFRAAGAVSLTISPANIGANLDIIAKLTNAQGRIIATSSPVDSLSAKIDATVVSGTYYLTIAGIGKPAIAAKVGVAANPGYPLYASLGQYEIRGTAQGALPVPPVAVIKAFAVTGYAPFTASFTSAASVGNLAITGFAWNFEEGGASVEPNPSYTFTKVGVFPVSLTVTNEYGLTSTKIVKITVKPAPIIPVFRSKAIDLTINPSPVAGVATVSVSTVGGLAVASAKVSGTWSGYFTGSGSAVTGATGKAIIKSAVVSASAGTSGTATFTITSIARTGYNYDATRNVETLKAITR